MRLRQRGPDGGGLSTTFSVPQVELPKVYEKLEGGLLSESDLFSVSVIQSTGAEAAYGKTTIKVSKTITQSLCNELRDTPRTFVLTAHAPMNLLLFTVAAPAWGGKFQIQCVEGKIEWDPTVVDPLDAEDGTTVQLKSLGARNDAWTITTAHPQLTRVHV